MAVIPVIMPKVGMYTEDILLLEWLRPDGARVAKGETLFTLETDKITSDVEADEDGWLHRAAEAGATVPIGAEVGSIATTREEFEELVARGPGHDGPASVGAETELRAAAPATAATARRRATATDGRRISPRARARLVALGLSVEDLEGVGGSGPGGRITDKDVERVAAARAAGSGPRIAERIPLAGRRRTIAARMVESLQTSAQLTSALEIDASALVAARAHTGAGYTTMFVAVAAAALHEHPLLNARLSEDAIEVLADVNVGFAVHTEDGVIVPVVQAADTLPLTELDTRVGELTARARAGTLTATDVEGGTFTVSNSGAFPVDLTTAILNPPQVAILWVGRVRERPFVVDGELTVRPTVQACLTFDHRVLDGAPAAEFLGALDRLIGAFPGEQA